MQAELKRIGKDLLGQLDQLAMTGIDLSLGSGELIEKISMSDNIVSSSYFFNLLQNLYTLPEFIDQALPGSEAINPNKYFPLPVVSLQDKNPVNSPGSVIDKNHDSRIEDLNSNTKRIQKGIEDYDNKGFTQNSKQDTIIDSEPKRFAQYLNPKVSGSKVDDPKTRSQNNTSQPSHADVSFEGEHSINPVEPTEPENTSSKTGKNPGRIGSFTDLANEFLPPENISSGKGSDKDPYYQPKAEIHRSRVSYENKSVTKKVATGEINKEIPFSNLSTGENEEYKSGCSLGKVPEYKNIQQEDFGKNANPESSKISIHPENNKLKGDLTKSITFSSFLENAIRGTQSGEVQVLVKKIEELLSVQIPGDGSDDLPHATQKVEPESYFERHSVSQKRDFLPGSIKTQISEDINQNKTFFIGTFEPIVSLLKTTKSEAKLDHSAYHEMQKIKLNFRRFYGI